MLSGGDSIVLVHGLGSKYATTWTHKRKDGTRYRWIQGSFAKDIPDARILGFEYPSRWYSDPIHTDLTECAWQLVQSLIEDRCNGHAKMDRNVVSDNPPRRGPDVHSRCKFR